MAQRKVTEDVEWREPGPPRAGIVGKWERALAPLVQHPGRWAMVFTADSPEQALDAAGNLRQRKVRIPHPDHEWEFAARDEEVFAIYRGRGRPKPQHKKQPRARARTGSKS